MNRHSVLYEQLVAFAAGELDTSSALFISAHLANCSECSATVRRFYFVRAALTQDDLLAPPTATLLRAQSLFTPRAAPIARRKSGSGRPVHSSSPALPVLSALVLALVLLLGSLRALAPTVETTLPGDTFYPIKMTIEGMQIAASVDPVTRGQMELTIANMRVKEIQQLADQHRYSQIPATAQQYEGAVQNATHTLDQVTQQDLAGHISLAEQAAHDLLQNTTKLALVQQVTPAEIQPGIARAVDASHQAQANVQMQLDQPNPGTSVLSPSVTPEPKTTPSLSVSPVLTDTVPLEPTATAVSLPTIAPLATETPIPTRAQPSDTLVPTATIETSVPTPANTAIPPTGTAVPTAAPAPTDAPVPTLGVESPANPTHAPDKKQR